MNWSETGMNPVGVFDSGVGGISVLAQIRRTLPHEDLIYFGDTAHAPYGTKTESEVLGFSLQVVHELLQRKIKALVIACNTASAVAAAALREQLEIPVIAMEPALKPAAEARHGGTILVLATPMTLSLPKFHRLYAQYGEGAVPVPCPGLMDLVEQENMQGAREYLQRVFSGYAPESLDAVVLGCTHYVFLKPMIRQMLPEHVCVMDGNEGTARQLERVLEGKNLLNPSGEGSIQLMTSGDKSLVLPQMQRLLDRMECVLDGEHGIG